MEDVRRILIASSALLLSIHNAGRDDQFHLSGGSSGC